MNCNLIMQGDELYIPFTIKYNNEYLKIEEVERIQFSVGELIKYYDKTNSEEVTYDEETHQFRFPHEINLSIHKERSELMSSGTSLPSQDPSSPTADSSY